VKPLAAAGVPLQCSTFTKFFALAPCCFLDSEHTSSGAATSQAFLGVQILSNALPEPFAPAFEEK